MEAIFSFDRDPLIDPLLLTVVQLYKEDPETGKMYVALSSDSTCQNDLKSPQEGYETLVLTAVLPPPLPFEVIHCGSIRIGFFLKPITPALTG